MQVKDVMTTCVVDVQPESALWVAIQKMGLHKVSGLPVVNQAGALVGVLSEGDLLRRVELGTAGRADPWYKHLFRSGGAAEAYTATHAHVVGDVMSRNPVTIDPTAPLEEAVALMERHRVRRLPVLEDGRMVGIVSRSDFLHALGPMLAPSYEEPMTSDAEIERTILAEMRGQDWAQDAIIAASASNGHVALRGTVATEAQRTALRVLAEGVNGVRSVTVEGVVSDQMVGMTP